MKDLTGALAGYLEARGWPETLQGLLADAFQAGALAGVERLLRDVEPAETAAGILADEMDALAADCETRAYAGEAASRAADHAMGQLSGIVRRSAK